MGCGDNSYVDSRGLVGSARQQEVLGEMGLDLVDSCPSGWGEMTYKFSHLHMLGTSERMVTFGNGEISRESHPHGVTRKAKKLRWGMYREGVGTWFSMSMHIIQPGRFKVHFNYDEEPGGYMLPPDPREFIEDLKLFPRSPENIPMWLQEKLLHPDGEDL